MPHANSRNLPYCADSAAYMRALSALPMPAFLDSANHGGSDGSLDILAADPVAFLQVVDGEFSCSKNVNAELTNTTESTRFLSNIRLLKSLFVPDSTFETSDRADRQLTHAGSLIGYLGYPDLTGKAGLSIRDAFVGAYLWTLVIDHRRQSCELRAHPSCTEKSIDRVLATIQASIAKVKASEPGPFSLESSFSNETSREQYRHAFGEIKSHIDSGDCYQVNLTQSFKTQTRGDPLSAYLKLRQATTAPFSAYLRWDAGALLSLSPERFIQLEQDTVLTQPVKGTRPRGSSEPEDRRLQQELADSEKDRAENLMIVDLLRNDLGRVCETGSIEVNQLFTIKSFSNVHHMVSDVVGRLSAEKDALDLLASCYPGGSITGAPKLAAMKVIQQVEQQPRRVYCGTVFCLGPEGSLDSSITIRSLFWQGGTLSCWAGGGIVADSDCDQEYQECFDKIENIFRALQN